MASYIFYKADGTIVMQRNYKDLDSANIVCNMNSGVSVMEGYVKNINLTSWFVGFSLLWFLLAFK